jgi:hypothetical protein
VKKINLLFIITISLVLFNSCEDPPTELLNNGFLTYGSGIGITEGISIASYDDGYVLLGNTDTGDETDYFIVKTDNNGFIKRSKIYAGDRHLDNVAKEVLIKDDIIHVLGDRYDRVIQRVIPFISEYNLSDLEPLSDSGIIHLDEIRGIAPGADFYEEKGAGFFFNEDIIYVVTTLENTNGTHNIVVYKINETSSSSNTFTLISLPNLPSLIAPKILVKSIKKKDNTTMYITGTMSELDNKGERAKGYFVLTYDLITQNAKTFYKEIPDNTSDLLDFEIVNKEEDNLVILYREGNEAKLDIIELVADSIDFKSTVALGNIAAVDSVKYDNETISIIDRTTKASIKRIDDNFIITSITENKETFVSKINITGASVGFLWEKPWKIYNTTIFNRQNRNNTGNIVRKNDGEGCAIIGTHDFINDTRMVLMRLDENGDYVE